MSETRPLNAEECATLIASARRYGALCGRHGALEDAAREARRLIERSSDFDCPIFSELLKNQAAAVAAGYEEAIK